MLNTHAHDVRLLFIEREWREGTGKDSCSLCVIPSYNHTDLAQFIVRGWGGMEWAEFTCVVGDVRLLLCVLLPKTDHLWSGGGGGGGGGRGQGGGEGAVGGGADTGDRRKQAGYQRNMTCRIQKPLPTAHKERGRHGVWKRYTLS